MAMQRLKEAAEKAKIELSSSMSTEINLPYLFPVDNVPKHLVCTLTRAAFENMISDIVDKTMEPCRSVLEAAKISKDEIDEIILVGGSTRIPAIQKAVEDFFGKQANKSVNPDEVVAAGAAIQGGILGGDESVSSDILLLDVTPLDLRIVVEHGTQVLVERNTTIPTSKSETFTNAIDNQDVATIVVLQGNRPQAENCKQLGRFDIELTKAPRGHCQIEVQFDIDANGVIQVKATDKQSGKSKDIRITDNGNLSKEEIERMKAEAEKFEEQDKKEVELTKSLNEIESHAYGIKQSMSEDAFKNIVTEEQKTDIEKKTEAVFEAVKNRDLEKAKESEKALMEMFEPLAKKLYESQQATTSNSENTASTNESTENTSEQEVQDADFEEVK